MQLKTILKVFLGILVKKSPKGYHVVTRKYPFIKNYLRFIFPQLDNEFFNNGTRTYWLLNDIKDFPKCKNPNCCNTLSHKNAIVTTGYGKGYCSITCEMNDEAHQEELRNIFQKKFNANSYPESKQFKAMMSDVAKHRTPEQKRAIILKRENSTIERFNVKNVLCRNSSVRAKFEAIMEKQYGSKHWNNQKKHAETVQQHKLKDPLYQDKINAKRKKTRAEKEKANPLYKKRILEKRHLTKQYKREIDPDYDAKRIRKTIETNRKRHGYDWPIQSPEIRHKMRKRYTYKSISFDSVPEIAYYIWLTDHCIKFTYHPDIRLIYYDKKMRKHYYEPDFLLEDTNRLEEIKNRYIMSITSAEKISCMVNNNVKIIYDEEYKKYIEYCKQKFNNQMWYLQFKNS